jgi:hypothetical protein
MEDDILKIKITKELIQDLLSFHGINAIHELKKLAQEQMVLNDNKRYEFITGRNILGEWKTSKTFSSEEVDKLEQMINSRILSQEEFLKQLNSFF